MTAICLGAIFLGGLSLLVGRGSAWDTVFSQCDAAVSHRRVHSSGSATSRMGASMYKIGLARKYYTLDRCRPGLLLRRWLAFSDAAQNVATPFSHTPETSQYSAFVCSGVHSFCRAALDHIQQSYVRQCSCGPHLEAAFLQNFRFLFADFVHRFAHE